MEETSAVSVRDVLKIIVLETTSWPRKVRLGTRGCRNESEMERVFLVLLIEDTGKERTTKRFFLIVIAKALKETENVVLEIL